MSLALRLRETFAGSQRDVAMDGRVVANRLRTLMPAVVALVRAGAPVTPADIETAAQAMGATTDAIMAAARSSVGWVRGSVSRHVGYVYGELCAREGRVLTVEEFGPVAAAFVTALRQETREDLAFDGDSGADVGIAGVVCALTMRRKIEQAILLSRRGFARDPFKPAEPVVEQCIRWIYQRGDQALSRALGGASPKEMTQHAVARLRESFHRQAAVVLEAALCHQSSVSNAQITRAWSQLDRPARAQWWVKFQGTKPYGLDVDAALEDAGRAFDETVDRALQPLGPSHDEDPDLEAGQTGSRPTLRRA